MLLPVYIISVCILYFSSNAMGLLYKKRMEPDIIPERPLTRFFRDPVKDKEESNSEAHKPENQASKQKDKNDALFEAITSPVTEFGKELKRSLAFFKHRLNTFESAVGTFTIEPISHLGEGVTQSIGLYKGKKSAYENAFEDPEWKKQWYMHDYRTVLGPVMDLNVVPVYRMGFTGAGIYVAVVDSGVEMDHPDLQSNLVKELSFTANGDIKGSAEPMTNFFTQKKDTHGTNTAGVIGMTANNSFCGAGMAYDAKLVAINAFVKIDFGQVKGKALSHARDIVDIYSNSWGPTDSGTHMEPIRKTTAMAIDYGTKHGRGGLGSIYTFAGGNGKLTNDDNCSADEVVNYIHTIAIAGAKQNGKRAEFSESCTAIYATTYSGGFASSLVVTTTIGGECKANFSGTSAATPQASAIIALVLQANNRLTYRDVMHLITMGSEVAPLADNESWNKNGAGFWVSNEFGFGLMNAYNMVKLALKWTNVPEKTICEFKFKIDKDIFFRMNEPAKLRQTSEGCQNSEKLEERVFYLEQVMLTSSIEHRYRGAISINLKSPRGTESEVLTPRINDKDHRGITEWDSKSVHHWGEDPKGEWQIVVKVIYSREGFAKFLENMYQTFVKFLRHGIGKFLENTYQTLIKPMKFQKPDYYETGKLVAFTLWFHGTRDTPNHHTRGLVPRTYSAFTTPDGKSSIVYNN